jgi:outer membrane lipoprotein-sorting protein
MFHLLVSLALLACALGSAVAAPKKITNTPELITAMQKKYAGKWYKTATFVQKTVEYDKEGKSKTSIWYEAFAAPGQLRIDFEPIKDGNGILFANNHLYSFKDGKLERSQAFVHPLLLLGFDVYFLPPEQTIASLKEMKFDLSVLHEDSWQGRPVYVVGAKEGDLHAPQFWIDQERLYFVRMLRPAGAGGTATSETQFNKYQRLAGGWIETEVIFMVNGKVATTEEYSDIRGNVPLDKNLFDPQQWTTATHWKK